MAARFHHLQLSTRCQNLPQLVYSAISAKNYNRIQHAIPCAQDCRLFRSASIQCARHYSSFYKTDIHHQINTKAPSFPKVERTCCIYNGSLRRQYCQVATDQQTSDHDEGETLKETRAERALSLLGNVDNFLSIEQWKKLRDIFLKSVEKTWTFEKKVMSSIVTLGYLEMGQSLFEFLRSEGKIISDDMAGTFLASCIENDKLDHVFEWYEKQIKSGLTVSQSLMPVIIKGYCLSKRWRESLPLLRQAPKSRSYAHVIAAACQHQDLELVMELVREIKKQDIIPFNQSVVHILETLKTVREAAEDEEFRKMAEMLVTEMMNRHAEKRTYPDFEEIKAVKQWYLGRKDSRWQVRFGSILTSGECKNCKAQLKPLEISKEQFVTLKEQLLEKTCMGEGRILTFISALKCGQNTRMKVNFLVEEQHTIVKGSDIYRKTTPEELEAFMQFVGENPRYDIIIDGLNTAKLNNCPQHKQMKQLYQFIVHLAQECGHKCLVLGRQHMLNVRKADKFYMDGVQDLADCFFTNNLTKDDPFMLYATLHSGPDARYVTYDMLRDHKALLDDEMNTIFYRWQMSRQLVPLYSRNGKIAFKRTYNADVVVQSTEDSWHIPYDDGAPRFSYQRPITWLCARKPHTGNRKWNQMGV